MNGVPFPLGPCVLALVMTAAAWDWQTRRIPNWLIVMALPIALLAQCVALGVAGGSLNWLEGLVVGGLLFMPGYLMRALGAGDVKLMAVVGAFCGAGIATEIAAFACVLGGIWALASLILRRRMRSGLSNTMSMLFAWSGGAQGIAQQGEILRAESVGRLPYGVVIAFGTLIAVFLAI
jgi:prepilin peptidase CpaA